MKLLESVSISESLNGQFMIAAKLFTHDIIIL